MDIYAFQAYSTTAWLATQGAIMALSPQFALSFLSDSTAQAAASRVSNLRYWSIPFFLIAAATFLLKPSALSSTFPTPDEKQPVPSATATTPPLSELVLPTTTMLHAALAIFGYTRYVDPRAPGSSTLAWLYMVVCAGSAAVGFGAMMFGSESRPGRGSRWPFESSAQRMRRKEKWEGRKDRLKNL